MSTLTKEENALEAAALAELKPRLRTGTLFRLREPLAKKTTLRVGGPADLYIEPDSERDLAEVLVFCARTGTPLMMLGRGSNLLIRDGGIRGVVVALNHANFTRIELDGARLRCGAGARLKAIANDAKRALLTGFEFLEGIPGNLGGALRMNAGAMGAATFDLVESVRSMDRAGNVLETAARDIPVEYRECAFFRDHIALGAVLVGKPAALAEIEIKMQANNRKRWDSQPAAPSAGCIFKNSPAIPSGRLVDELGLKGARIGGACVSTVHGNFIVNDENASARDVLELIELIKTKAKEERGIELRTEVQIVGEEPEI